MNRTLLAGVLCGLLLAGCDQAVPLKKFSESREMFGSITRLDVCYTPGQEEVLGHTIAQIWLRWQDIHHRLSVYDPESDLNRINRSYPNPVVVGADTWTLISDAVTYHHLSRGEFDITLYPLLKLWKEAEQAGVLPTADQIQAAQQPMGVDKFELLAGNQIRLLNPDTQLIIDSIADGYAADEAARILRVHGFSNFLLDASGELYAGGRACQGGSWRVGVKDPQDPLSSGLVGVIMLKDAAVTTSGSYEHFYTIAGKMYSHIISPRTGFARNDIVSATVIAPSAEFSDALSTALCLIDPARGIALVDSLGDGYASMILVNDGKGRLTQMTSRYYPRYLAR